MFPESADDTPWRDQDEIGDELEGEPTEGLDSWNLASWACVECFLPAALGCPCNNSQRML
jgi:hypothetical protein